MFNLLKFYINFILIFFLWASRSGAMYEEKELSFQQKTYNPAPCVRSIDIKVDLNNRWYNEEVEEIADVGPVSESVERFLLLVLKKAENIRVYHNIKANAEASPPKKKYLSDFAGVDISQRLKILEQKDKFYRFEAHKHKLWVHEKNIFFIFERSIKSIDSSVQIKTSKKYQIANSEESKSSLDLPNIFLANNLTLLLKLPQNKYYSHNCGIHALLACVTMMWPDKLNELIIAAGNEDDLVPYLEEISLPNNLPILSPVPYFEKLFRSKVGIVPNKLKLVGEELLFKLELDAEIKLRETDDFAELLEHWQSIIKAGSPVIVLTRPGQDFLGGHLVVIHSILADDRLGMWNQGYNTANTKEFESTIDCQASLAMKATAKLAGINKRFVYLYFITVQPVPAP